MKKHLTLLICASFIFLFIFAASGNSAKAAELQSTTTIGIATKIANTITANDDCGCNVKPILGSERNKMVAELISSDEFKNVKMAASAMGYQWLGAGEIEIINNTTYNMILSGVPFSKDGQIFMFVFIDGKFAGVTPM